MRFAGAQTCQTRHWLLSLCAQGIARWGRVAPPWQARRVQETRRTLAPGASASPPLPLSGRFAPAPGALWGHTSRAGCPRARLLGLAVQWCCLSRAWLGSLGLSRWRDVATSAVNAASRTGQRGSHAHPRRAPGCPRSSRVASTGRRACRRARLSAATSQAAETACSSQGTGRLRPHGEVKILPSGIGLASLVWVSGGNLLWASQPAFISAQLAFCSGTSHPVPSRQVTPPTFFCP